MKPGRGNLATWHRGNVAPGGNAVKAMTSAVVQAREDEEDSEESVHFCFLNCVSNLFQTSLVYSRKDSIESILMLKGKHVNCL